MSVDVRSVDNVDAYNQVLKEHLIIIVFIRNPEGKVLVLKYGEMHPSAQWTFPSEVVSLADVSDVVAAEGIVHRIARDATHVFNLYASKGSGNTVFGVLEGFDPKTIRAIGRTGEYVVDAAHVYHTFTQREMDGADAATFGKDAKHVYFARTVLAGADVATFQAELPVETPVPSMHDAKDTRGCYFQGQKIEQVDNVA